MISVSMENSLATIGGFCCGTSFVVDHQVCHDLLHFTHPKVVSKMGVVVTKQDATLFIMGTSGFLCDKHWTSKHLSKPLV